MFYEKWIDKNRFPIYVYSFSDLAWLLHLLSIFSHGSYLMALRKDCYYLLILANVLLQYSHPFLHSQQTLVDIIKHYLSDVVVMEHYCWFYISFNVFNGSIHRSAEYSPTWSKNTEDILNYSFWSRLSEVVHTLSFRQISWVWSHQPCFQGENFFSNQKLWHLVEGATINSFWWRQINCSRFKLFPEFRVFQNTYVIITAIFSDISKSEAVSCFANSKQD